MNKILYYYCSPHVFESILKNKELWLTDVTKSNDSAETRLLVELIERELDSILQSCNSETGEDERRKVYQRAKRFISDIERKVHYFAMCFTHSRDRLIHWRAYGSDGKGFALGFDSYRLKQHCKKLRDLNENDLFFLREICYVEDSLRKKATELMDKLKSQIQYDCPTNKDGTLEMVRKWANAVRVEAPNFKTKAFEAEQESRLYSSKAISIKQLQEQDAGILLENIDFHIREADCVAHIKFPIQAKQGVITEVLIGPANNADIDTIRMILVKHGFTDSIIVKKSESTYRK